MTDWVLKLIDGGGYWGIALLMVLENVFPPIPSELIMGVGGIRVGQGRMEMIPLLIAGTIGTTIGNCAWYFLGRTVGIGRLKPFVDRFGRWLTLDWCEIEGLNRVFHRRGDAIIFFFRFMPAFRTIVSLPAGLFRMSLWRFLVFTTAGALIWNVLLVAAGYYLGANFKAIDAYLGPLATGTVVAALAFYGYRLVRWKPRDRRVVQPAE